MAQRVKRFTASGAIESGKQEICGVQVKGLGTDVSVDIYDADGVVEAQKVWGTHLQPGVSDFYPLEYTLHDGGYVDIDTNAEVFVYLE